MSDRIETLAAPKATIMSGEVVTVLDVFVDENNVRRAKFATKAGLVMQCSYSTLSFDAERIAHHESFGL